MVPLQNMKEFNWARQIRTTLISSIAQNNRKSERVIGCVMLLMVNPGELFTTQIEMQKYQHTILKLEPYCDDSPITSVKYDENKNERQGRSNTKFFAEAIDLNDNNDDINIEFSSPTSKRGLLVARTTQNDIMEMLVKENRKVWGIIRQ
ncbi:hypothetical protein CsSME_00035933 [Camellia sinensis var. sinensis]